MKPLSLLLLWLSCCSRALIAQPTTHISLDDLRAIKLPEVQLESAEEVKPDLQKNLTIKSFVQVKGVIGDTIRFELLLPDEWNHRFVMGGGGGFVGTVQNMARDSVNRGFATVGTDTGHEWEPGYMATWAFNNIEAQLNFGYLAVHRTAEVAKALIRAYYKKDPEHCYFVGCSRGGGQAMMESQRYPKDFDGIVAGAPAFNWTGFAASMVAIAKALYPDPAHLDSTVLTKEALQNLQQSIIEQCDTEDGLKDGIIQDPAAVHFQLAKVSGLTDEQRNAIESIYQGASGTLGDMAPGYPRGAECDPDQWIAWLVGPIPPMVAKDRVPDLTFAFGTQVFKYLVFDDPDWDYSKYNFTTFEKDTRLAASFLNAIDPKLEGFKARKGKLILWHGWADPALPAQATADYYRKVLAWDSNAAQYCRLFMVPGCLHCGGGKGASEVDWLSVIVDWVEKDQAPERIIAGKTERGKRIMTRPLYPYPQRALYKGAGDPNNAENFESKPPAKSGN